MLNIKRFIFNPLLVNCYVLYGEKHGILVDPSFSNNNEEKELYDFVNNQNIKIIQIIVTHFHFDHLLGAYDAVNLFKAPLSAHADYVYIMGNFCIKTQSAFFGYSIKTPPIPKIILKDNDIIYIENESLKVIHTPGHSPCSICLYYEKGNLLLSGDTLFYEGIGRTDLPGGNADLLRKSIKNKLYTLPPSTLVYPGHGEQTTIENEIKYGFL
ncbi:MAG: MBL fold metallo-hydrolase [Bacteroidales bacterium]|nr:MBL fold metallo-hydrolase [Bacteroidales bacterium]